MLSESVRGAAVRFGDRAAVCTEDASITWAQMHAASESLASMLCARGIRPGDVVALALRSGPTWAVAATAINRVGAVIAGLSPVSSPSERSAMVSAVEPRLVLAEAALADGLPLRTEVAVLSVDGLEDQMGSSSAIPEHDRGDDRPYAICFTSGTTGAPKAAAFRVAQARAVMHIDLGDAATRWGGGSPMISSTQFAHVGFLLKFPYHARMGSTLHVMRRWRADKALHLLAQHSMPTLGAVAPQLALMMRSEVLDEIDLSALRLVIAGGAASPSALISEVRARMGVDYSVRWSSTESGGVGLAALISDAHPETEVGIGTPRAGVQARVGDPDGTSVPDGEVGELQVRSAAMMQGYLGDVTATEAAFTSDGWLRTGDLATRDHLGRFALAGRASEMYIRGGYNVHPAEVEAAIGTHPGVREVVVIARVDEVMGEVGVAVVVPSDHRPPPTLDELREFGSRTLADYKLPESIIFTDRLPRTAADKIDRRAVSKLSRP